MIPMAMFVKLEIILYNVSRNQIVTAEIMYTVGPLKATTVGYLSAALFLANNFTFLKLQLVYPVKYIWSV